MFYLFSLSEQYFGVCILQVSVSLVANVFILHLNFRGSRGLPVPAWMRSVILGKLGFILCYGGVAREMSSEQKRTGDQEQLTVQKDATRAAGKVG